MIIIIAGLWLSIGSAGLNFWWRSEYQSKNSRLQTEWPPMVLQIVVPTIGPFAWIVGYFIHGQR